MALTTQVRGIPQRLRETYPPIEDDAFEQALAKILARFDGMPQPDIPASHEFTRSGLTRSACLIFVEKIAVAAAIDGVTIAHRSSFVKGGLVDMTLKVLGEKKVMHRLTPLIRAREWPR